MESSQPWFSLFRAILLVNLLAGKSGLEKKNNQRLQKEPSKTTQ